MGIADGDFDDETLSSDPKPRNEKIDMKKSPTALGKEAMESTMEEIASTASTTTPKTPPGSESGAGCGNVMRTSLFNRSLVGKKVKTGGGVFVGLAEIEESEDGCSVGISDGDSVCPLDGDSLGAVEGGSGTSAQH